MQVTEADPGSGLVLLVARVLLSALFIVSGIEKIFSYQATAGFMQANGIPSVLLPLVILVETAGGAAVLFGFKTRFFALLLALFNVLVAVLLHNELSNRIHFILFWSDLAIAGGFLLLFAGGAGRWSIDQRLRHGW